MGKVRYVILLEGEVQKGGFRSFIKKQALMRGITGYAENLSSGEMLAVLEGESRDLEELLRIIEEEAPAYIRVGRITKRKEKYTGSFTDFERKGMDVLPELAEGSTREILNSMASTLISLDDKFEVGVERLGEISSKQDKTIEILKDVKKDTSAMIEKQDKTIEILKDVKKDTSAMIEKQDKTIEILKDVKKDTSAMIEKQDKTIEILKDVKKDTSTMIEKQDKTIEILKDVKKDTSAINNNTKNMPDMLPKIFDELDRIKKALIKAGIEI